MLGAGTVINPLVKIVTTVVVLGAVYLFIVKPVLDTTDGVINDIGAGIDQAKEDSQLAFRDAQLEAAGSRAQSYAQSLQSAWPAAAREVKSCIRAAGDLAAMNRCDDFARRVVHTVQSDRSFALSYAQSLSAQGDGSAAARVEACVKQAGYTPAPMQRCRNLADQLLFG
jgi:hypothetical protein